MSTKPLVLISGVTGFVGSAVTLAFIEAGYRVRGAVRSQKKVDEWLKAHPEAKGSIEWSFVQDITAPHAFDEAVKGVTYVAHVASPFVTNVKDAEKDLLIPAINGTLRMLEAASTEPKLKRVVITSSHASMIDFSKGYWPGHAYSEADWNPTTYDQAKKAKLPEMGGYVYCASKVLAEHAAWDYVSQHKPHFSIATICPPMIYGPPSHVIHSMDALNESMETFYSNINGSTKVVGETPFPVFVDVRDVARAHVLAAEKPVAAGQRYVLTSGNYLNDDMVNILSKRFPEKANLIAKPLGGDRPEMYTCDHSKAVKELGLTFRNLEQVTVDTAQALWKLADELKSH